MSAAEQPDGMNHLPESVFSAACELETLLPVNVFTYQQIHFMKRASPYYFIFIIRSI